MFREVKRMCTSLLCRLTEPLRLVFAHHAEGRRRAHVLLLVFAGFTLMSGCTVADSVGAARNGQCRDCIKQIVQAVRVYMEEHGDIPRDDQGIFSIEPLFCDDGVRHDYCLDRELIYCPFFPQWKPESPQDLITGYVTSPVVEMNDFVNEEIGASVIVMAHRPEAIHEAQPFDGPFISVLLGSGDRKEYYVSPDEYRDWLEDFKAGKDGSNRLDSLLRIGRDVQQARESAKR